ncbi:DUF4179 domain-containing protein [Peribacillus sp. NPDC097225]|uniref:DUF4179 domain-containing protein n=1 Tax=Peribacillus sp. NPDC097225 TaxID=3364400 RepID=UPI003800D980
MKDFYELLNDIDLDESEFKEMEVTELDKTRVKKRLKKSILKKKKSKGWQRKVMTASILFALTSATIGISFTAYASNIPVIGDIFRFLEDENGKHNDKGVYHDFKDYSNNINLTEKSNGITFTINDAIYDGKTVTITYSIESEEDLGNESLYIPDPNIKEMKAQAGTDYTSKVSENKYVGLLTASNIDNAKNDTVHIKWDIDHIASTSMDKEIKGKWNFAFSLQTTKSNEQVINKSVEQDGVKVSIEKISISPMSFVIHYNQEVSDLVKNKWDDAYVELTIKDDLGNVYSGEHNGGNGKKSSKTFQKIDKNATKLIATPHLTLSNYTSENHGEVTISENGKKKVTSFPKKPTTAPQDSVMDDIIINLKE